MGGKDSSSFFISLSIRLVWLGFLIVSGLFHN